uniref:Uncharacterized protein n=1 Tax=Candidatus Kentrum sp. DK TaxID=2126562 RepID=A0A450S0F5_9GAMM|nr:MAG: hypothetical protein BECKDK2373B_GA0170837_10097 [Candidatus Kentron sp. DK]
MIHERIKKRLVKDRAMAPVTFNLPEDVLDDLDGIASRLGLSGHRALIRSYISAGMRRDEERLFFTPDGEDAGSPETKATEPGIIKIVSASAARPVHAVG